VWGEKKKMGRADAPWLPLLLLCSSCCFCIWPQKQILVAADTDPNDVTVLNTLFTSGGRGPWRISGIADMPLTWLGSSSSYPLSSQPRFLLSSPLLFSSLVVWVCPCLPSPSSSPFPSSLPPSHKRESARLSPGEDSAMKGAKSKGAAKPDAK
jgi:hypothetical protein